MPPVFPVSARRRRPSLTGIFWAYSFPLGVSIPDVWHLRASFPSSLSRGGKCFSCGGRKPKEKQGAHPVPFLPAGSRSQGGRSPIRGGGAGPALTSSA